MISDCIALITAGNSLDDPNDAVNWIVDEGQTLTQNIGGWTGVSLSAFDNTARITEVEITDEGVTGTLAG